METEELSTSEREQVDRAKDLATKIKKTADDRAFDQMEAALVALSGRKDTPTQVNTRAAIEAAAPPPERAPALSAGRTKPASDIRYEYLPKWQRSFRTPEMDHELQRYLVALVGKDQTVLREFHAMDREHRRKHQQFRVDIAEGDIGATGGAFDGTAGELVPLNLANYINAAVYRMGRVRTWARNFPTSSNNLRVPMQNTVSSSSWTAENIAITPVEPAVSDSLVMQLQDLTNLAGVSNQILADAMGLATWLLSDVGGEMAEKEDEALYSSGAGSASNEPRGFEANDTTLAAAPTYYVPVAVDQFPANDFTSVATLTAVHLTKMWFALPERERANAIWMGGDQVAQVLSNLVDVQGRPILNFQNQPLSIVGDTEASGQVGTIFGRPFVSMAGKQAADPAVPGQDENRLYLANFDRTYAVLDAGAVAVAASSDFEFNKNKTTFRFVRRVDGGVIGNNIATRPQYVYTGSIIGT